MSTTEAADVGLGLGLLLGILAVGAAGASYYWPGTEVAAWGFAAAMTFGVLSVAAIHRYA